MWHCESAATRLLRLWDRIPPEALMFVVSVVCYQVEVCATRWSLVQRSPNDCGVSECGLEASRMKKPCPPLGRSATGVKSIAFYKGKTTTLKNGNIYIILKFLILLRELKEKWNFRTCWFMAIEIKRKHVCRHCDWHQSFMTSSSISSPKRRFCDGSYNSPLTVCSINCLWNEFWLQWYSMIYITPIKQASYELRVRFVVKAFEKCGISECTALTENMGLIFNLVTYCEEWCVDNLLMRIKVFRDMAKRCLVFSDRSFVCFYWFNLQVTPLGPPWRWRQKTHSETSKTIYQSIRHKKNFVSTP
jgi:hypothetical protein